MVEFVKPCVRSQKWFWDFWPHDVVSQPQVRQDSQGVPTVSFWDKPSVQFSSFCSVVSDSLRPHGLQHARPPCPSSIPRVYSNSCLWCHPTISSSVVPLSSHLQYFPASRSFQMSQFFASGGQSIGVSASTSVLPVNTQGWSPLGWTGWKSLQSNDPTKILFKLINEFSIVA